MTCYTGLGSLADGRPVWTGDFNGDGRSEFLFHNLVDQTWWLGRWNSQAMGWTRAGDTSGFGKVGDGRPIWIADFAGTGRTDVLFYFPGDSRWWLGQFDAADQLQWTDAGDTAGFGNVGDGRPIWTGDFTGDGRTDVLFYFPGDHNWWLGSFTSTALSWRAVGNTQGFGNLADGRPIWVGDFTGTGADQVLFYAPGDQNWWLGSFASGELSWSLVGNTTGFGQVWDGRPIWTADFTGDGRTDVLFNFPGDQNWWLGSFASGQLSWSLAGSTTGFGNVADGRPIWTGDFAGDKRTDLLFYFPGDNNWWLGSFDSSAQLSWSLAGNTGGFGQVWDGRPFWLGDLTGDGKTDITFYAPGDGNLWLGSVDAGALRWRLTGNVGRPGRERVTVHFKSLLPLTDARRRYLDDQYAVTEALFSAGGNVAVMRGTTEDLSGALPAFQTIDVGDCNMGTTTADQDQLYENRNGAGADDIVIYLVNTLLGSDGNYLGCAAHPAGRPGCLISPSMARWLTAHEIGHVLGLPHIEDPTRLMNPDVGWTEVPPDLDAAEYTTMLASPLTIPC